MSIYKPCDIRGNATAELSPELYRNWGRHLGREVAGKGPFVVGGDVRDSTPKFLEALAAGLIEANAQVISLGQLPTPMVYFAKRHFQAAGCAIVTASHNPAQINGLKWMLGDRPPTEQDVQELEQPTEPPADRKPDVLPEVQDIGPDYVEWLKSAWTSTATTGRLRVVVDPMFGCWAGRGVPCLKAVFPGVEFSAVRDTAEEDFGGGSPDCSRVGHLEPLQQAVRREKADLGMAFDGDGDRVALVDNQGTPFSPEQATWALLQSFGRELAGERFVYDLKFSDRVPEAARALGAEPVAERSGHAFIRTRMLETGAKFGAEVSGHYFFGELDGGDDGLYAGGRMIELLARSGRSASELRQACPKVCMTPDLRLQVDLPGRQAIIDRVKEAWAKHPQVTIDGVRVEFPEGWALVRSSVTEPALTFRFEALDRESLDRLIRRYCDVLGKQGDELWQRYAGSIQ